VANVADVIGPPWRSLTQGLHDGLAVHDLAVDENQAEARARTATSTVPRRCRRSSDGHVRPRVEPQPVVVPVDGRAPAGPALIGQPPRRLDTSPFADPNRTVRRASQR
jgi:hypothetical protein